MEGLAPVLKEAVGLELALALRDWEEEGVEQGVAVAEPVPLPV